MPSESYYLAIEARIAALLSALPTLPVRPEQISVEEYLDHNELGLALEDLVAGVAEVGGSLTNEQAEEIADLVRTMEMDESIAAEARSLVR